MKAPKHPVMLGGPIARLRRWLLIHIARYDGELCQFCGGRYDGTIWWSPHWLWKVIAAGRPLSLCCPPCFSREAERLSACLIGWRPMPLTEWDAYVESELKTASIEMEV